MPATVTMPLEELDAIKQTARDRNDEISKLKQNLVDLRIAKSDGDYLKLAASLREAMKIVGYAVANLHPEFSKRWPFEALRTVAEGIKTLPDFTAHDGEFAFELQKFAIECETWETRRKQQGERYIPEPKETPLPGSLLDAINKVKSAEDRLQTTAPVDPDDD